MCVCVYVCVGGYPESRRLAADNLSLSTRVDQVSFLEQ